jgi:protein-tyrosine phosphatase
MVTTTGRLPTPREIDKFGWLEEWLGRGAEPSLAGYRWLARNGFKTVVNLQSHDAEGIVRSSEADLEPIHIPVRDNTAPSEEQALMWLELCSSPYLRPVFVHCHGGEGRTSTFCALVRIAQGWPLEKAIREQISFGFSPELENREQARFLHAFVQKLRGKRFTQLVSLFLENNDKTES